MLPAMQPQPRNFNSKKQNHINYFQDETESKTNIYYNSNPQSWDDWFSQRKILEDFGVVSESLELLSHFI